MISGLIILGVLIFIGILINKSAMKKIQSAFSALLGKGADKAIEIDPVAVYRDRVEKSAEELRKAVLLLESHSSLIRQLKRNLEADKGEHDIIESRIKKYLEESNTDKANEYAERLVTLEEKIEHLKQRLESAETTYKQQTIKIKDLKEKIVGFKEKAGRLKSDLQTSKAEAEISMLTQKFDSNSMGFDDLKEIENVIQDQIDKNESKATVAQDLYTPDLKTEIMNETRMKKAADVLERLKIKDYLKRIRKKLYLRMKIIKKVKEKDINNLSIVIVITTIIMNPFLLILRNKDDRIYSTPVIGYYKHNNIQYLKKDDYTHVDIFSEKINDALGNYYSFYLTMPSKSSNELIMRVALFLIKPSLNNTLNKADSIIFNKYKDRIRYAIKNYNQHIPLSYH